ncbi:hypothetical protein BgiBS90_016282, partial [Biomphalaria glabrata]
MSATHSSPGIERFGRLKMARVTYFNPSLYFTFPALSYKSVSLLAHLYAARWLEPRIK